MQFVVFVAMLSAIFVVGYRRFRGTSGSKWSVYRQDARKVQAKRHGALARRPKLSSLSQ